MFGQVIDKLDTWLGRSFLLSRYIPWIVCAAANLCIAMLEFPSMRGWVAMEYGSITTSKALDLVLALLALAIVAYATSPIVQFVTRILEGERLPKWIAEPLTYMQAAKLAEYDQEFRYRFDERSRLPETKEIVSRLRLDRAVGAELEGIRDTAAIDRAEDAIKSLRIKRRLNRGIGQQEFVRVVQALSTALRRNCVEISRFTWPVAVDDEQYAKLLDRLYDEATEDLAPYVLAIAQQQEARAADRRQRLFAVGELAPTRLGNDAAALRSYCATRYGFEFDFFWPHFLLVLQRNDKLSASISTAKIQLDFSVLALTLTIFSTLGWFVPFMIFGATYWALLVIVAICPLAAWAWLHIVHASYSAFAEIVRGAIDIGRFDLLRALHRPLPLTAEAEKTMWQKINQRLIRDEHEIDVTFSHPAA